VSRLRVLVLGPDCNPEGVSIPYVTYSHAAALTQNHDVSLVIRLTVEDRVRRAKVRRVPNRRIEIAGRPSRLARGSSAAAAIRDDTSW